MAYQISDASEIHFWPIGEDSFNLEQEGYTDDYCFHQKFLCSGLRRLQVVGGADDDDELRLSILENGVEVETIDFTQTNDGVAGSAGTPAVPGITSSITLPVPSLGANIPASFSNWSGGSNPNIILSNAGSKRSNIWAWNYSFIDGYTYSFTPNLDYIFNATASLCRIYFAILDSSNVVVYTERVDFLPGSSGTLSFLSPFVAGSNYAKYGFYVSCFSPSSGLSYFDIDPFTAATQTTPGTPAIPAVPATPATHYLNSIAFSPYDYSLCDKFLSFKIIQKAVDPEDEVELFYSAEVEFVSVWANSNHSGRVFIQFRSIQNFAELIYDDASPYFSIELDGRFRKERKISVQKTLELTEMVLNTAASVKKQKKLTLNDIPDYMHTKVQLILAHAASGSVIVNGLEISLEEGYEEGSRPESYPLTPAEVFLTDKNYYKHNVI